MILLLAFGTVPLACSEDPPAPSPPTTGGTSGRGQAGASDSAGSAGEGGSGSQADFPCAIRRVIEAKCQRCHTSPPENGAPFPLLTWDDTRAPYGTELVYQAMLVAVESGFMPLVELPLTPPVEDLTTAERAALVSWLEGGAEPDRSGAACPPR